MDDAVQEGTEQTVPEESQTSEDQSTDDELESEDYSSGEDVNAQSEDDGEDLVDQAMNTVKAEKSVNRVQELANQNRSLKEEVEALRQQSLQQLGQAPQTQDEYLSAELVRLRAEQQQTREELAWNNAVRSIPALDPAHEDYSREFENIVYANYLVRQQKGESVTPALVAKETQEYLTRASQKLAKQGDVVRQVKKSVSPIGGQRSPSDSEYTKYQSTRDRFMKSGSVDDLADLLADT